MSSAFAVLFAGALFFNITAANAVADLNISVTESGQPLGGATVSLTFPDGSSQTVEDDDDDGRIALVLRNPGRYRLTITTPDGRSSSTSFNAPSDGSVTVDYNAATGSPRVSVNDTSPKTAGRADSPWSGGLYGTFGFSDWNSQFFDGDDWFDGNDGNMRKWGIGAELRYSFPKSDFFLSNRFFYHAKGRFQQPVEIWSGYDLDLRERWRNQMLLGWSLKNTDRMMFNLLAGITFAKMNMHILNGSSNWLDKSEVQVAPTFGLR